MRSLLLGLLVLALGAGGYYAWRHRPEPTRPPLFAGEPPKLDVPPSRVSAPKPGADAVLVEPESLGSADPRAVKGQDPRPRPLGDVAQTIAAGGSAPPAPLDTPGAAERLAPPEAPPRPPTALDKLASPGGAACLLVIAAVVYFGVTRGLRREPDAGA